MVRDMEAITNANDRSESRSLESVPAEYPDLATEVRDMIRRAKGNPPPAPGPDDPF